MDLTLQSDGATPIARTRRYERDRGFTRAGHVVVPDWETPIRTYDDDALAARYERERVRDDEYAQWRQPVESIVDALAPMFAHLDRADV